MNHLTRLILVFSLLFAFFMVMPTMLYQPFTLYPLMKNWYVIDIFTAIVLLPLYWLMFRVNHDSAPSSLETVIFIIFAAAWASGQGMHLSANSIAPLLKGTETSDLYVLNHFYDEILSHYIWHLGVIGLSAMAIYRQWRHSFKGEIIHFGPVRIAGIFHGFIYFIIIIEGSTGPIGIPFSLIVTLFVWGWGRRKMKQQPLLAFFYTAYLTAAIMFLIWGIVWGGFPQFSDVGIIP